MASVEADKILFHMDDDFDSAVFGFAGSGRIGRHRFAFAAANRPNLLIRQSLLGQVPKHGEGTLSRQLLVVFPV